MRESYSKFSKELKKILQFNSSQLAKMKKSIPDMSLAKTL